MYNQINLVFPFNKFNKDFAHNVAVDILDHPDIKGTTSKVKTISNAVEKEINNILYQMSRYSSMLHGATHNPEHYVICQTMINDSTPPVTLGGLKNANGQRRQIRIHSYAKSYFYKIEYLGTNTIKLLSAVSLKPEFKSSLGDWVGEFFKNFNQHAVSVLLTQCNDLDDINSYAKISDDMRLVTANQSRFPRTLRDVCDEMAKVTGSGIQDNSRIKMLMDRIRQDPSAMLVEVDGELMFKEFCQNDLRKYSARELEKLFDLISFTVYDYICRYFEANKNDTEFVDKFYLPHIYKQCSTGRLFGSSKFNLQTTSKLVRNVALSNFVDYDIDTSALTLLYQICENEAIPTFNAKMYKSQQKTHQDVYFKYYMENKNLFRALLAKAVHDGVGEIPGVIYEDLSPKEQQEWIKCIKSAITALNFGAKLAIKVVYDKKTKSPSMIPSLVKIFLDVSPYKGNLKKSIPFAEDCARVLIYNKLFANLAEEQKRVCRIVTKHYRNLLKANGNLELYPGAVFKSVFVEDSNGKIIDKTKSSKLLAYIYQTNERRVLDVMMKAAGDSLLLPIHDGIAVKKAFSPAELQGLITDIKTKTNFNITFSFDIYRAGTKLESSHNVTSPSESAIFKGYEQSGLLLSNNERDNPVIEKVVTNYVFDSMVKNIMSKNKRDQVNTYIMDLVPIGIKKVFTVDSLSKVSRFIDNLTTLAIDADLWNHYAQVVHYFISTEYDNFKFKPLEDCKYTGYNVPTISAEQSDVICKGMLVVLEDNNWSGVGYTC